MAIPGGWHGSDPGYLDSDPRRGVVTVDVTRIVDAIEWLKRRATILETRVSRTTGHWGGSDPGIVIVYRLRGKVRTGGGSVEAAHVETIPVPPPKVRAGIETRWKDGRWERLLKRGWVSP